MDTTVQCLPKVCRQTVKTADVKELEEVGNVDLLIAQIEEAGLQTRPVLVKAGKHFVIAHGKRRVRACKILGIVEFEAFVFNATSLTDSNLRDLLQVQVIPFNDKDEQEREMGRVYDLIVHIRGAR